MGAIAMQLRLSNAESRQKRVLAVHDISCVGRCSLTVALPVLSAMGFETSILPTSILSTHTGGFTGYTYRDLVADMNPIVDHWKCLGLCFDAIFSGWLATLDQDYVNAMRQYCARAQILLPNLTEAALLTDTPYPASGYDRAYIEDMLKRLCDSGAGIAVLTGVSLSPGRIGAAAYCRADGQFCYCDSEFIPGCWHGAGDVFASALLGACLWGQPANAALKIAVDFTARCIRRTQAAGTDERLGLQFEPELTQLARLTGKNENLK